MTTDLDFITYVIEQGGLGIRTTFKRMFGEYALYLDEKVVAFACDNSLFIKPTEAAERLPGLPQRPPYPGAKHYYVADELLDDADALRSLILETAVLLPVAKRGKRKPRLCVATGIRPTPCSSDLPRCRGAPRRRRSGSPEHR
jgi:TfoX/Sxy family transcriptional regulator of competence genes